MTYKTFRQCHLLWNKGFSLIELVLVTAILSIVGITVYSTMASGINIWQRITAETVTEDIGLFLERISGDLRNTFNYEGIRFQGAKDKVSFPGLVRSLMNKTSKETVGEISYVYDPNTKTVGLIEKNYSQIYRDRSVPERPLISGIYSLSFQYYYFDAETKDFLWISNWQIRDKTLGVQDKEDVLPLAVRVKLEVEENGNAKAFTKTVWIPGGCCPPQLPRHP